MFKKTKPTVLSVRPKITDLDYHLFAQEVHPELFEVCSERRIERKQYSLETNITTDGHVIRFYYDDRVLTEINAGAHHPLPSHGELLTHSILGRTEEEFEIDRVRYHTSTHIETVNPKMFVAVQQQLDKRVECKGQVHRFGSNGRLSFGAISYIDVQSFLSKVLIRCFHTFPESSAVLTSETRISVDAL